MSGQSAERERVCGCPPCPGRGNDGHGMTHCAECCFGSGVEADLGCPIHGETAVESLARALSHYNPGHGDYRTAGKWLNEALAADAAITTPIPPSEGDQ